jgi:hypothetical protein
MQSIQVYGYQDPQLTGTLQDDPLPAAPGHPGFWDAQGGWKSPEDLGTPLVARLPSTAEVPQILFEARDGTGYEVHLFSTDTLEYTTLEGGPIPGPQPQLTELSSTSATIGGPDVLLKVSGTGFSRGALIVWNGTPESTTVVTLETTINMASATTPGSYPVAVVNPDGQVSEPLMFEIQEPAARSRRGSRED